MYSPSETKSSATTVGSEATSASYTWAEGSRLSVSPVILGVYIVYVKNHRSGMNLVFNKVLK